MVKAPVIHRDKDNISTIAVESCHAQLDTEDWMVFLEAALGNGCRGLIIDARAMTMPSSPFMSSMVWARRLCQEQGLDCCLVAPSPRLRRALEVTDLASLLLCAETREEGRQLLLAKPSAE